MSERIEHDFQGRVWEVRTFPLSDQEGGVSGVIRLAADITEKTRLRQENLRAGRLAALGELSAGVAHEINNPNGLILMSLPTLRDVFADVRSILDAYHAQQGDFDLAGVSYRTMREEIPMLLDEMTDGARRVKRIVEDLKNFVRREKADEEELFDLNDAVQRALRLAANPLEKCADAVTVELTEAPLMVLGVSARIEQVLVNLILNSCQALTGSSRRLWVRTRIDVETHVAVTEVEDEGQGISPEDLPRITDPFFTTRRREGGTGLGLSVSSRIVREHQGKLEFSSRAGQGTRVVLTLPLSDEEVSFDR
jgi:signal transduction histidine kinase